jgi:catechol 2,3-dioxygenase-like lactoylglutathione lyase family enzyme
MRVHKLAWLGTRTDNAADTVAFFRSLLGLEVDHEEPDFVVLRLPDGAKVEVFGPGSPHNHHFTTGPVAGFLVDDVEAATAELVAAGVEVVQAPVHDDAHGNAWVHVRAPDGNLYELTQDPSVERPR